jgi:hypothetical protein
MEFHADLLFLIEPLLFCIVTFKAAEAMVDLDDVFCPRALPLGSASILATDKFHSHVDLLLFSNANRLQWLALMNIKLLVGILG